MRLCIIGPDKRTDTDIELLNKAKKIFDSVLFVPQSSLTLKNSRIVYKKINIDSFDVVLPRIPKKRSIFAYAVLKNMDTYTPIPAEAYFIASDRFLFLEHLSKNKVATPNIYMLNSPYVLSSVQDQIEFPVSIRLPSKENGIMFIENRKEIRAVLDTLGTFDEPIYIEEFSGSSYFQIFVIGKTTIGLRRKIKEKSNMYLGGGKIISSGIPGEVRKLALHSAEALKSDFCRVDIAENRVVNISLAPPLTEVENTLNIDLSSRLLEFIKHSAAKRKAPILERIFSEISEISWPRF